LNETLSSLGSLLVAIRKVPNECYKLLKFSSKGASLSQKNWQGNFQKNHDMTFLWCIEQLMKTATLEPKVVKNVLPAGCGIKYN